MNSIYKKVALSLLALGVFILQANAEPAKTESVVFAGGCFWCMEPPFDNTQGVTATISGYSGGEKNDPSYKDVSSGRSGHYEVLKVEYDPEKVSYQELLDVFWKNIDPFDDSGQFCDKGPQYRSAIFYTNEAEKQAAEESKANTQERLKDKGEIVTPILKADTFYPAEEYHQNFYKKNPVRYKLYRKGCGRDRRLAELWAE